MHRLVRKGAVSDPETVGHNGRTRAKATPLLWLDRAVRCRDNLVEWTKALLHAAMRRSARRVGTWRRGVEWCGLGVHSYIPSCCRTVRATSIAGTLPSHAETRRPTWSEGVCASANPQGRGFESPRKFVNVLAEHAAQSGCREPRATLPRQLCRLAQGCGCMGGEHNVQTRSVARRLVVPRQRGQAVNALLSAASPKGHRKHQRCVGPRASLARRRHRLA